MFVVKLTWDKWDWDKPDADQLEQFALSSPSVPDIEKAIRRLDGKHFSLVVIYGDGEAHMAIAGGNSDQYIVSASYDNERFFTPENSDKDTKPVYLFAGGQRGDYPENMVTNLEASLAAARIFAENCTLDPSLTWTEK